MKNNMKKKPHSAEFKFKAAIEAIRGEKTTAELCQQYGIVSSQLFKWKKALLDKGQEVFKNGTPTKDQGEVEIEKLHATIGRLTVENSFLAKVAGRYR
ncbi:MAG: transposase [Dolichospermum sp.]|jgi:transposase-like protein|nr:transposase [Dolichospermum sp.]